ncbi:lipopolysaccharide biosynthesis protein [Pantoea sp. USHLN256]|uniref:lipopolysaccharide biosynthesis protein n=1 Tax=Pantoea sp. USHLN256 TaxID=3081293 RepID=UPI00301A7DEF
MKNKTIRDFANYALGDLFVKGFLFISLPLLSRVLSPEEYGKLSIINTAIMIVYVFVSLNLQNAITNRYMLVSEGFGDYFKTIIVFLFPFQIIILLLSPLLSNPISLILGIDPKDFIWVIVICMMLSYLYIYTCYLQASRQSSAYVKINMISKISEIFLIFIFAYVMTQQQYMSKIYAQLVVTSFILICLFRRLRDLSIGVFKIKYLKEALVFSIPLIIHVLSNSLLSQADRIIINNILGASAAGIYSFAYNLGAGILVLIMAWNSSWQPRLYKCIEKKDTSTILQITKASTIIIFVISTIVILFSKEMILIFADKTYYSGADVLPVIIIGNSLIHLYLIFVNFIFYKKRTIIISIATLIAVMINIGFNYLLIPMFGIIGSAWATVFSYLILTLLHYVSSKYITANNLISFKFVVYYFLGLIMVYYLTKYIELNMSVLQSVFVKICIALVSIALLFKMKLHHKLSD